MLRLVRSSSSLLTRSSMFFSTQAKGGKKSTATATTTTTSTAAKPAAAAATATATPSPSSSSTTTAMKTEIDEATMKEINTAISATGNAGRYAKTIVLQAMKQQSLRSVLSDLKIIKSMLNNVQIRMQFNNPILQQSELAQLVVSIADKCKVQTKLARGVLYDLLKKQRTDEFNQIVNEVAHIIRIIRKESHVVVNLSNSLKPEQQKRLEDVLKQRIPHHRRLVVQYRLNQNIYGGMIIYLDGKMIDLSVNSMLRTVEGTLRDSLSSQ